MFGRATITLGIGAHSSFFKISVVGSVGLGFRIGVRVRITRVRVSVVV